MYFCYMRDMRSVSDGIVVLYVYVHTSIGTWSVEFSNAAQYRCIGILLLYVHVAIRMIHTCTYYVCVCVCVCVC